MKPGYKQTEVGIIPEDWGIRPLGLICAVRDGTHESPRFLKDGVPFVTSKNIVNGRLDLENVSFISKSDAAGCPPFFRDGRFEGSLTPALAKRS
jgi:type I restriction enzyme S subunit